MLEGRPTTDCCRVNVCAETDMLNALGKRELHWNCLMLAFRPRALVGWHLVEIRGSASAPR
jgi:hypothetical protein